jgi:multiple sugar transport system permease protein
MSQISAVVPAVEQSRRLKRSIYSSDNWIAYLLILPSLVGFALFYALPTIRGLFISFTDWNLLTPAKYVGLSNYKELFRDPDFWNAIKVTVSYVLWNIPLQTALALVFALVMNAVAGSNLLRGLMLLPWLMPNVVVGLLWLWLVDPNVGILNVAIKVISGSSIPFLSSPKYAIPTIAWINIWRHMGYTALLVFAGLQTIPKEVYEAASIDGASSRQTFFRVTLPLLRPVLTFVIVTSVIGSFQVFDTVAITTKGGPINATKVFNYFIYQQAFERFRMGYATAISIILFVILVGVSILQMRLMRAGEVD